MRNEHNTLEEMALYTMQSLAVEESASIRAHLQICAACRTDHARVGIDLALMGLVVQGRELPVGARERFMKRIAASAFVKPQNLPPGVATIPLRSASHGRDSWASLGGSGRRDGLTGLPGKAKILEISGGRIAYNLDSTTIETKSLLKLKIPDPMAARIRREATSQITAAKPTPYRVAAARIVNMF